MFQKLGFRFKTLKPYTERELVYMRVLNEILIKPNWWLKLENPEIILKWRCEIKQNLTSLLSHELNFEEENDDDILLNYEEQPNKKVTVDDNGEVTDVKVDLDADYGDFDYGIEGLVTLEQFISRAVDYMIEELRYISVERMIHHKNGGIISPIACHGVFISDSIIPVDFIKKLVTDVAPLEQISLRKGKWHEGSGERVLDIVHPSDYCLVYGRSKLLENDQLIGSQTIEFNGPLSHDVSSYFQWLPAEFHIEEEKVSIESRINNLDSIEVSQDISLIFQSMIPMFELALGSIETEPNLRINKNLDNNQPLFEDFACHEFRKQKFGNDVKFSSFGHIKDIKRDEYFDFEEANYETLFRRWEIETTKKLPGLPDQIVTFTDTSQSLGNDVQVIVKMANIHLTPERPSFEGGSWHLEGMENEAIAATGIVYYSMENITSSRLTFRSVFDPSEFSYPQNEFAGFEKMYRLKNERSLSVQICGEIEALENRCVVFPNFLHHKVQGFELKDKSKPGHRKILAFFLVHPDRKILSTKNVSIQQEYLMATILFDEIFSKILPFEVVYNIARFLESTMSEAEAAEYASQLMEERKNIRDDRHGYPNLEEINFCEH